MSRVARSIAVLLLAGLVVVGALIFLGERVPQRFGTVGPHLDGASQAP